jgi:hypothetical protein
MIRILGFINKYIFYTSTYEIFYILIREENSSYVSHKFLDKIKFYVDIIFLQ